MGKRLVGTLGDGTGENSVDLQDVEALIEEHVEDSTPHPAYDSPLRPSLTALYQNALI